METLKRTRSTPPCRDTHPFLTFGFDAGTIHRWTWMQLGEAASKVEHIASTPMPPAIQQELLLVFLAKGVQATTAIEGNTLTEQQVRLAVDGQLHVPPSQQYLQREVENVLNACNEVAAAVKRGEHYPITRDSILHLNAIILDGLQLESGVIPGAIREHPVVVGNVYRAVPAACCSQTLDALVEWLDHDDEWNSIAEHDGPWRTAVALMRALVGHLYLAWIHPFGDGNGRTARLVELAILANAGVPLPAAHLLSNHFNATRSEYYRKLTQASETPGDISPFLQYAIDGFADGLAGQLRVVHGWIFTLAWSRTVRDALTRQDMSDEVRDRRARVADALAARGRDGVPRARVPALNDVIASAYAGKTPKTVTRDLNVLQQLGLVRSEGGHFIANVDLLGVFLPDRFLPD